MNHHFRRPWSGHWGTTGRLAWTWLFAVLLQPVPAVFSPQSQSSAAAPCCVTDDADVIIDTSSKGVPLSGEANGLIHALTNTDPPQSLLAPLALKSYRGRPNFVVDPQTGNYARLKALGVRHVQIVLSDHIGYPPAAGHWPGDDGNFSLLDTAIEELMNATVNMQDIRSRLDTVNEITGTLKDIRRPPAFLHFFRISKFDFV